MQSFIKTFTTILCLSLFIVSCSGDEDTGHIIVKQNEVIGDERKNITAPNIDTKSPSIEEEKDTENLDAEAKQEYDALIAYDEQIDNINELRDLITADIFINGDDRIIDDLFDFEEEYFQELNDFVENHAIDNIEQFKIDVANEIDFYEDRFDSKWDDLEASL